MRGRHKAIVASIIILSFLYIPYVFAEDDIWYYQPSPQGLVGVSRPTITWVFDSLGKNKISDVEIIIDGDSYQGHYDEKNKRITYKPINPMEEGEHNVTIIVTINNDQKIKSSFKFQIDEDPLSEISNVQSIGDVRETINKYRDIIGIKKVEFNSSLNMAAKSHSKYLNENKDTGHFEYNKKSSLFTGETPEDRAKYFNYTSPIVAENISSLKSHQLAVMSWVDSAYHRLPLINPSFTEIGYGNINDGGNYINVLKLGAKSFYSVEEQIIIYPADGQKHIPLTWSGRESPNPLRQFTGVKDSTGYPISLSVFGEGVKGIKVNKVLLSSDEGKVSTYILVPKLENERMSNSTYLKSDENLKTDIILIPTEKLNPNRKYSVEISGKIIYMKKPEGEFSKKWSFTTGDGNFKFDYKGNKENLNIYYGEEEIYFKNKPFLVNGTTIVPIREYCEAIGAIVEWREQERAVVVKLDNISVTLRAESYKASLDKANSNNVTLKNGISFGPIRYITEALGFKVNWDGEYRDIYVSK